MTEQPAGPSPESAGPSSESAGPSSEPAGQSSQSSGPGSPSPSRYDIRNLRRSTDDRMIAGVCGGLGRYTGVDPIIFRIVLATLAVFGGAGLLIYALAWLFVPDENADTSQANRILRGHAGALATIAAVILGIFGVLSLIDVTDHGARSSFSILIILAVIGVIVASRRRQAGHLAGGPYAPPYTGRYVTPPAGGAASGFFGSGIPGSAEFSPAPGSTAPLGPPAGFAPSRPAQASAPAWSPSPSAPPSARLSGPPTWSPPPPRPPRQPAVLVPLALSAGVVLMGVLFALDASNRMDISAQSILAAALLTIGLALVVGTWIGRARALIGFGVVLTAALMVTAAIDVPLHGGVGSRAYRPTVLSDVRPSYHLGVGEETLDLRGLQVGGNTVHVAASVGMGRLFVQVPAGTTIIAHGRAGAGDVRILGTDTSGTDVTRTVTVPAQAVPPAGGAASGGAATPTGGGEIDLDLRVGLGQVEVVQSSSSQTPASQTPSSQTPSTQPAGSTP